MNIPSPLRHAFIWVIAVIISTALVLTASSLALPAFAENIPTTVTELPFSHLLGMNNSNVKISDVSISGITDTSAEIDWETNKKTYATVLYHPATSTQRMLYWSPVNEERQKEHSTELTDLMPGTKYHAYIVAYNVNGKVGFSSLQTFTTIGTDPTPVPEQPVIETVTVDTATSTLAWPAMTANMYTGEIEIWVSGAVQASNTSWSDAFYVFTNDTGNPVTPVPANTYSLFVDGEKVWMIAELPYQPSHSYYFKYDVGDTPKKINFAIGAMDVNDNYGSWQVTVKGETGN